MNEIIGNSFSIVKDSIFHTIHWPFLYLYKNGPSWLGMWEGLPTKDICAGLTLVSSDVWETLDPSCNALIIRHTHATVLGFSVISILILANSACNACFLRTIIQNKWGPTTPHEISQR